MISDLVIEDYQSVGKAAFTLGKRLTVITGPTGSGKSAVVRAMRLIAFNQRGVSFVRNGAKFCKVGLAVKDEGVAAVIQRGKGGGKDFYRLVTLADGKPEVATFTKLAGSVPEQAESALRLSDVNFAGQFDSPFLITASGAEVARRLGELTNVTILLSAAREADRRRLRVSGDLKRAEARLAGLQEELQGYRDLPALRERAALAEQAVSHVRELGLAHGHLQRSILAVTGWEENVTRMAALASQVPVPSLERAEQLASQRSVLAARRAALQSAEQEAERQEQIAVTLAEAERAAVHEYHELLVTAGRCPTCGQRVDPLGQLGARLFGDRDLPDPGHRLPGLGGCRQACPGAGGSHPARPGSRQAGGRGARGLPLGR